MKINFVMEARSEKARINDEFPVATSQASLLKKFHSSPRAKTHCQVRRERKKSDFLNIL
jgi:hypothetical protein